MAPERRVDPNDPAAAPPARVLVVDDHEVAREALCSILGREPDLEVVGEAADGEMAVSLARRPWSYLVLLDGRVPGTAGLTAARRTKARSPATPVLLLTTYETPDDLLAGCGPAPVATGSRAPRSRSYSR